ncbi:NAD(P)H-quinone oxidoreductase subunit I, chloroplastic [bioreactor metagenome]|uniref:NAD(P)H-quinone oxidoreductase subunit I, chloroplastic n=1 Tax=bioreactor metagenome TaxID=1076179 RepID=A0A644YXI5_9ZZZZ
MPAIINFKICDNAPECSGIEVCPTKAITYNETKKTLEIDETKCITCGLCVKACPVGAIKAAKGKDFEEIKKEYEKDTRRTSDLFIERYGAASMDPTALVSPIFLQSQIDKKLTLVTEIYDDDLAMCLVKSIPIKDLFKNKILYYKINIKFAPEIIKEYKIKKLPCLLFFKDGQLTGKIEGYYGIEKKTELLTKISQLS